MDISPINHQLNELINDSEEKQGILSVWGDVGVGKTTICMSAALAKLATGKKVIYIYTKPEFNETRFNQLKSAYKAFDLFNLILYHPTSVPQLVKIITNLEFLILEEKRLIGESRIGLIVLDTATTLFHLNMGSELMSQEMDTTLGLILSMLENILSQYQIPIIIANRLTMKFSDNEKTFVEQPASERVVNYFAKFSLKIERTNDTGYRELILEKVPNLQPTSQPISQSVTQPKKVKVKLSHLGFE